ncbi:MAG TPA: hypothetical protein VJQ54_10655 [Candidatus Sulfotelmatobacter sp.]|nr:hypothetical protein [Candidatus Sulfotelmatobacter sp.]
MGLLLEIEHTTAPFPVVGLWTACTRLKRHIVTGASFSLTEKIEGVKTYSFFDSFLSFSGWCGVRGSSEVTFSDRKVAEGGQARVYSKALVEENGEEMLKAG